MNFTGDSFVKTNVIARLLQSEVEHAKSTDNSDTAITTENYKFTYKGVQEVEGQPLCHVFQVKPRKNRVGLFKGTVYLNVYTAGMVRAEGKMVKSPSFFVKNIEFSQDYTRGGWLRHGFAHSLDSRRTHHRQDHRGHHPRRLCKHVACMSFRRLRQSRNSRRPPSRTVSFTVGER